MANETLSYSMATALRRIDQLKHMGWTSVSDLKACGIHGQTLRGLWRRCLIEKHFVGPIDDENLVRLTRAGRREI